MTDFILFERNVLVFVWLEISLSLFLWISVFVFRFADEKLEAELWEAEGVVFLVTAHVNLAGFVCFFF